MKTLYKVLFLVVSLSIAHSVYSQNQYHNFRLSNTEILEILAYDEFNLDDSIENNYHISYEKVMNDSTFIVSVTETKAFVCETKPFDYFKVGNHYIFEYDLFLDNKLKGYNTNHSDFSVPDSLFNYSNFSRFTDTYDPNHPACRILVFRTKYGPISYKLSRMDKS